MVLMVIVVGLAVMLARSVVPLHELKVHPAAGVAVSWTEDPALYAVWDGFSVTLPFPDVFSVTV